MIATDQHTTVDQIVETALAPTRERPFDETIAQTTPEQLDEIERRCRAGEHALNEAQITLGLSMIERERTERAFAAASAAQCEGMTGRAFARCTRPSRYLVADEYFGQTYRNGVLARDARIVELWGACLQHRAGLRADSSPYGSALDTWNHTEAGGSGCFNGRRLGSIELPTA